MPGVAVVTDSTTYLPPDLIERWGVHQVSLYVGWGDERLPEPEYELDAFYARLRDSPDLPSTSQPSLATSSPASSHSPKPATTSSPCDIASGLSGTCESAREAARAVAEKGLPGRVEVVDGQTGAGGLGCLVLAAARAAEQGSPAKDVVDAIHRTREGLDMWFCLDTLEYLRRGTGRPGRPAAFGTIPRRRPAPVPCPSSAEGGDVRPRPGAPPSCRYATNQLARVPQRQG